jgi:hypothetical protein
MKALDSVHTASKELIVKGPWTAMQQYLRLVSEVIGRGKCREPVSKTPAFQKKTERLRKESQRLAQGLGLAGLETTCGNCHYFELHSSLDWGVCRRQEHEMPLHRAYAEYPRGCRPIEFIDYVCEEWTPCPGEYRPAKEKLIGPSPEKVELM